LGVVVFFLLWPFVGIFIGFSFSGFSVVNRSGTTIEKFFQLDWQQIFFLLSASILGMLVFVV
jgi:hypothetical protein